MASFAVALVLLVAQGTQTGTSPAAGTGSQTAIEQELIALDKKFDEASRKGDTAFLRENLTDDLIRVSQNAEVRGKAEVLKTAEARAADPPATAMAGIDAPSEYTIRVHGDTAIMAHAEKPTDVSPAFAVIHVFVKQQGRWKMAAWGNTRGPFTTEMKINAAGYEFLAAGKTSEAVELFKMNVRLYPNSWNAYDSLGEAYAKTGDNALAIQNYDKSMQLNPKNETGRAALLKLKGQ